jgi:hypothetical protein
MGWLLVVPTGFEHLFLLSSPATKVADFADGVKIKRTASRSGVNAAADAAVNTSARTTVARIIALPRVSNPSCLISIGCNGWKSPKSYAVQRRRQMRLIAFPLVGVATLVGVVAFTSSPIGGGSGSL